MLRKLFEGRPFRHPLHPLLVHLPIGLFTLSLVLDLLAVLGSGGNTLVRAAFDTMLLGLLLAVLAAIPGFVDWSAIRLDHPARRIGTYHMVLNLVVMALYALNLGLRYGQLDASGTPTAPLLLSLVALALLMFSGYLGGMLIYDHGISVGRHRRDTAAPRETMHVSSADAREGFVPVLSASSLPEGQTLRVELDNDVMAIANIGGAFYAFQEFCTHRYGPLSEGALHDHQVECPWHRSCFDVRTGEVTQGPAKLKLRTYEVAVRDGWIAVRVEAPGREEQAPLSEREAGI